MNANRNTWKQRLRWLAVAVWMVVIFLFSAQNSQKSGDTSGAVLQWVLNLLYRGFETFPLSRQIAIRELWHTLIRKGAHFTEYAVLAMLLANAFWRSALSARLRWLLPVLISALYAITDEVHQYFVPGRACRLLDVGIDTCGAIFGICVLAALVALLRKRK